MLATNRNRTKKHTQLSAVFSSHPTYVPGQSNSSHRIFSRSYRRHLTNHHQLTQFGSYVRLFVVFSRFGTRGSRGCTAPTRGETWDDGSTGCCNNVLYLGQEPVPQHAACQDPSRTHVPWTKGKHSLPQRHLCRCFPDWGSWWTAHTKQLRSSKERIFACYNEQRSIAFWRQRVNGRHFRASQTKDEREFQRLRRLWNLKMDSA